MTTTPRRLVNANFGDGAIHDTAVNAVTAHGITTQQCAVTNDIDFSASIMTTVGVMYTENQYSLHMVNIDYIDSLGYVTYFDKQQGSIGYNNATDYSVFYTKE